MIELGAALLCFGCWALLRFVEWHDELEAKMRDADLEP